MNKKHLYIILLCVAIAAISGILGFRHAFEKTTASKQVITEKSKVMDIVPKFSIEYKIKPESIKDKLLSVCVRIYPDSASKTLDFYLAEGIFDVLEPVCKDQAGRELTIENRDGVIKISANRNDLQYIDYSYKIKIGQDIGGKVLGDLYEDLLVFSGENILLSPYFDLEEDMDSIDNYISRVSINVEGKSDWSGIMPYQKTYNSKQNFSIEIDKPDWNVFFNLTKSCYAFGKFESLPIATKKGYSIFFVDSACKSELTTENLDVMTRFYNYYSDIFGGTLENYAVVLLRSELKQNFAILGGVGGKTMGLSLRTDTGEGWYTFSNSLYHAFFDSKIRARNLHYAPNLWLYKGLTEYYVDKSSGVLTEDFKNKYIIKTNYDLHDVYSRYLYFSMKEASLKNVSPATETKNLLAGDEFYLKSKVPLVIETIEKMAHSMSGRENNLMNSLIKHSSEKNISLGSLMVEVLGKDEEKIRHYLAGQDIIPFPGEKNAEENKGDTVAMLDEYERELTELYRNEVQGYPYDPVALLNPVEIEKEAQKRKVKFATDKIQSMIKDYSETVYLLLLQNALRADICGVKDITDPGLRLKLNSEDNIKKWAEFVKKVGLYEPS